MPHPKVKRSPLNFEQLEPRDVPAGVTASLSNTILTITGTNNADTIRVTQVGDTLTVYDGTAILGTFSASRVSRAVVRAGGGDDRVDFSVRTSQVVQKPVTIYGEGGKDNLRGGAANDGLFGGAEADTLYGGGGADRFLYQSGDTITDKGATDAQVTFANTTGRGTGSEIYESASWADAEIIWVDEALADLHARTNNTKLLKTSSYLINNPSAEITLERVGRQVTRNTGIVHGENLGNRIIFSNTAFTRGVPAIHATVFHEIGHNWDTLEKNPDIATFQAVSSWTQANKSTDVRYQRSGDGRWYFLKTAPFADPRRDGYGKKNPQEDFADAFSVVFMQNRPGEGNTGTQVPKKDAEINALLNKLKS